jgi:hypothetical protein
LNKLLLLKQVNIYFKRFIRKFYKSTTQDSGYYREETSKMITKTSKRSAFFAFAIMLTLALSALLSTASADVPTENNWKGRGAMAHWEETTATSTVTMDAVFAEQYTDGSGAVQVNMLYVKAVHNKFHITSEKIVPLDATDFEWTGTNLHVQKTMKFTFMGPTPTDHLITIDWVASASPQTINYFVNAESATVPLTGKYNAAAANIQIGAATSPHADIYGSTWAMTGTQPTLDTCDASGNLKSTFSQGADIYVTGSYYGESASGNMYVFRDVATWTDGMDITALPSVVKETVAVSSGVIALTPLYPNAQPGLYDIFYDLNSNQQYDVGTDVLCNNVVLTTGGFFVVPEYALGGALLALVSCFAAFAVIRRRDTNPKLATQ